MANRPKQKGIDSPDKYFGGGIDTLYHPFIPFENSQSLDAAIWRYISRKQPVIMACIGTLIMKIQALPWTIRAVDADKNDELKEEIDRHKKILIEFGGWGYLNGLDLILQDYYMTPFGGAAEPVKYSDDRLYKLVPYDSATLFPTLNATFPVVQKVGAHEPIPFREDELIRIFNPRPEIERRGWGFAAVERVYLAVELLSRGDRYYAQMLLDTPEAGLLDLGDMSKESAEKWLESFRNMMTGIDAFKIPVIYQHTKEAKWIPFGRPPTDMLFDQITFKYAQLVTAAFGITTSDIGLRGTNGGSLSGEIRQERTSRSTGFASVKSKLTEFFNRVLPEELEFSFIDTDDELLVSKGRARSANAVAGRNLIESGALTPIEWRKQLVADGLVTIPLTEEPDEAAFDILKEIDGTADQLELQEKQLDVQQKIAAQKPKPVSGGQGGKGLNKQRNVRGGKLESVQGKDTVPASSGGQGEIKSRLDEYLTTNLSVVRSRINSPRSRKLIKMGIRNVYSAINTAADVQEDYDVWKSDYMTSIFASDSLASEQIKQLSNLVENDTWWKVDFDDTELGEILEEIYQNGTEFGAQQIQQAKYEDGLADTAEISGFERKSEDAIYEYAEELAKLINSDVDFYVKRLSLVSVVEASAYFQEVVKSQTMEELLKNEDFISYAVEVFDTNLVEILNYLSESINKSQTEKMFDQGIKTQKGLENAS